MEFNGKEDYAQEFKDVFESEVQYIKRRFIGEIETDTQSKLEDIVEKWRDDGGLNDANWTYAVVLLCRSNVSISTSDVLELCVSAEHKEANNKKLQSWFKEAANMVLDIRKTMGV